jgi:glycosyltransferase involved in cell wall biosynthesis
VSVGIVIIGRNEGERLRRCLLSVAAARPVVYVDSGSSDGSAALARELGATVVELEPSQPVTAARARNAGFARLAQLCPGLEFVQFVDGDCELVPGWLGAALSHMRAHPRAALACGRRRERFPDASVYNHLCQVEWDTQVGLVRSCGGDALVRAQAFVEVSGFAPQLIAGEEPDLCRRLHARGWEVWRIDAEMTLHDAAMLRFAQWWRRNVRAGYAAAQAVHRRAGRDVRAALRKVISNAAWSLPASWPLWPLLWLRIYGRRRDRLYATFTVLGKLPNLQGQLSFWLDRTRHRGCSIIEYK